MGFLYGFSVILHNKAMKNSLHTGSQINQTARMETAGIRCVVTCVYKNDITVSYPMSSRICSSVCRTICCYVNMCIWHFSIEHRTAGKYYIQFFSFTISKNVLEKQTLNRNVKHIQIGTLITSEWTTRFQFFKPKLLDHKIGFQISNLTFLAIKYQQIITKFITQNYNWY